MRTPVQKYSPRTKRKQNPQTPIRGLNDVARRLVNTPPVMNPLTTQGTPNTGESTTVSDVQKRFGYRTLLPLQATTYKEKEFAVNELLPISKKFKTSEKKGTVEGVGSHNPMYIMFTETPILIGRYATDQRGSSPEQELVGWGKAEAFAKKLIKGLKETITEKSSKFKQRNVDFQRTIRNKSKFINQGIEVKFMNGHGEFPPLHVRSSYKQFSALCSKKYSSHSGYLIISLDYHKRKDTKKNINKGDWLYTVWFVPIKNKKNWYYIYANHLGIEKGKRTRHSTLARHKNIKFRVREGDGKEGKTPTYKSRRPTVTTPNAFDFQPELE